MKDINYESAFEDNPFLKARYEAIKEACNWLSSDVYSGPYYLTSNPDCGEEVTALGETVKICSWGEEDITGGLFESDFASNVRDEVESIVADLPRYYTPDFEEWTQSEPQPVYCDNSWPQDEGYPLEVWYEDPTPYYEVSEGDWYAFFFSEMTWRDIMR